MHHHAWLGFILVYGLVYGWLVPRQKKDGRGCGGGKGAQAVVAETKEGSWDKIIPFCGELAQPHKRLRLQVCGCSSIPGIDKKQTNETLYTLLGHTIPTCLLITCSATELISEPPEEYRTSVIQSHLYT